MPENRLSTYVPSSQVVIRPRREISESNGMNTNRRSPVVLLRVYSYPDRCAHLESCSWTYQTWRRDGSSSYSSRGFPDVLVETLAAIFLHETALVSLRFHFSKRPVVRMLVELIALCVSYRKRLYGEWSDIALFVALRERYE